MIGLIMGPQGSGKGTQAELIEQDYNFKQVSMGDLLRIEKKENTEHGRLVKKIVDEGGLVPAEITNKLAAKAIKETENILFDGYPRSHEQADFLFENDFKMNFAIVIDLGEEETIKRISKRRICTATEKIFSVDNITEKDIEECREAGGEIIQRIDDTPSAIKTRLGIYHTETKPVIQKLKQHGVPVFRINGEQSIEDVFKDIQKAVGSILRNYFVAD